MNKLLNAANTAVPRNKILEAVDLAKKEFVVSIWRAANVEGLNTTFASTEAILENLPVMTKRDEVLFVLNMRDAQRFLLDNLEYNNCWMLLREFNNVAGRDLVPAPGVLRRTEISMGGTTWKPDIPSEPDVYEKISDLNKIVDPVEKALEYYCYITRAQLFNDGNKRVAQLMTNKILIENGVGIFSIPVNEVNDFKMLLIEFYETADNTRLKNFLRDKCIHLV